MSGSVNLGSGTTTTSGNVTVTSNSTLTAGGYSMSGGSLAISSGGGLTTGTFASNSSSSVTINGTLTATQSAQFGGATTLNGTLVSPSSTVLSTGSLSGNGSIQGNLTNSGTVTPQGLLTVTGDYTQNPGGVLSVNVDTTGTSDKLTITGTADTTRGNLKIRANRGFFSSGLSYNVIQASRGSTQFSSVDQPFSSLVLKFKQKTSGSVAVERQYKSVANDGRNKSAASAVDQINSTATSDMKTIVTNLDFSDQKSINTALSQMNGESQNVTTQSGMNAGSTMTSSTEERMETVRKESQSGGGTQPSQPSIPVPSKDRAMLMTSMNAGDLIDPAGNKWGVFVRYLGATGTQYGSSTRTGFNYTGNGFVMGFDRLITDHVLIGLNGGYMFTGVNVQDVAGSTAQVHSFRIGPYFSYFTDVWNVDATVGYTLNKNKMNRKIAFTGFSGEAQSDYNSNAFQASLSGGYMFTANGFRFGPTLGVDYVLTAQDKYSESGAGALNQTLMARTVHSLQVSPGARISRDFSVKDGTFLFTPELRLSYAHEFLDNDRLIQSNLQGMPGSTINTQSADPIRDMFKGGAGLTLKYRNFEFRADYEIMARQDMTSHAYSAGVRYTF